MKRQMSSGGSRPVILKHLGGAFYEISAMRARQLLGKPLPKPGREAYIKITDRAYWIARDPAGTGIWTIREELGPAALSHMQQLPHPLGKLNPPNKRLKIYNRVEGVIASKSGMPHRCDAACKKAGHRYHHEFSEKACIYGLADGSLLVY
jgi:hypothetical protein